METDLPALCVRVWGKVPAAAPDKKTHIEVQTNLLYPESVETDMIQAACLRWLLENCPVGLSMYKSRLEAFLVGDVEANDLTTCLLLAVERCHEWKNKENKQ